VTSFDIELPILRWPPMGPRHKGTYAPRRPKATIFR